MVSAANSPRNLSRLFPGSSAFPSCPGAHESSFDKSISSNSRTQATSQTSGKSVIKSLALSPREFKGKPWILIKLEALQEKAYLSLFLNAIKCL